MRKVSFVAGVLAAMMAATGSTAEDGSVKIGVLTDMSGQNSNFGGKGSVVAAELAVEDIGGSALGHPIEIVSADHRNKPDVGASIARQWYENDGVDLIVDIPSSAVALAVAGIAKDTKKLVFTSGSSTSRLVEEDCSPYTAQWTYDSYALAKGVAGTLVKEGGKKWFFITADYAAGHSIEGAFEGFLTAEGGEVVGGVRHPVGTTDYTSYLLQGQASGADVIGIINFGEDSINTLKQASEFGIADAGQKMAVFFMSDPQINAAGLDVMKGLVFVTSFVWNKNEETRAWTERFKAKAGQMPSDFHASVYSATLSYLKGVNAAGTDEADAVMAAVKAAPVDDMYAHGGRILPNGLHVHDLSLVEVKSPDEQKEEGDNMKILASIAGTDAFRPIEDSVCDLAKSN
ncbi:ABC transporter substrate-binding protein [Pseudooceanicola sp. 216_PA32_1]|jgi:branched-chain amino acid transport system substrate-binding protein|uniref:ABC transporter substrate-binding protein n=1 Tax=Pseudooceanicola pacificus TaxID=2676438 RepID=A0A844WAA3_9RHOB|nr:ABC transporter substrate-binding protein [Pseudooceanicola pacificus]MWB77538.1 ABC transporter substrate-binding protein [Pseudooceanicola pacificus]